MTQIYQEHVAKNSCGTVLRFGAMKRLSCIEALDVRNLLLLISYGIYMLFMVGSATLFASMFAGPVLKIAMGACVCFLLVSELISRDRLEYLGLLVVLLAIVAAVRISSEKLALLYPLLFVYCLRNMDFTTIAKVTLSLLTALMFVVIICSQTDVIKDYVWEGERVRHGLGFRYCTFPSFFYLDIVMLVVLIRGRKLRASEVCVLFLLDVLLYIFTESRTSCLLIAALLVMAYLAGNMKISHEFSSHFVSVIAVGPFIVLPIAMIVLSVTYDPDIKWMANLDQLMSYRLHYTHASLANYGVSAFGQQLNLSSHILGADGSYNFNNGGDTNFIDSSYMYILMHFGYVPLMVILGCMIRIGVVASRHKDIYLGLVMFTLAFHALMDAQLASLEYTTVLFLGLNTTFSKTGSLKKLAEPTTARTGVSVHEVLYRHDKAAPVAKNANNMTGSVIEKAPASALTRLA